jgi:hypothetical protein
MWAATDNGRDINWATAKSYCENYHGGEYMDWRLPTQDELAGLYDGYIKGNNNFRLTTQITLTACCPWASEIRGTEAAFFNFYNGCRYWTGQSIKGNDRVLPVRYGK